MWHDGPVVSAQFSPNGRRVVTASSDYTARLWDNTLSVAARSEP
jgi:WD40 repeat protein